MTFTESMDRVGLVKLVFLLLFPFFVYFGSHCLVLRHQTYIPAQVQTTWFLFKDEPETLFPGPKITRQGLCKFLLSYINGCGSKKWLHARCEQQLNCRKWHIHTSCYLQLLKYGQFWKMYGNLQLIEYYHYSWEAVIWEYCLTIQPM